MYPQGVSIFPYLCISIACGAISGFHATQSLMMARCLGNEAQGRRVLYGAMISEGIVALVWATVKYSSNRGKNYWIALIPAMYMTVVITSYIIIAPEGFVRFFQGVPVGTIETIGNISGIVLSVIFTAMFFMSLRKSKVCAEN